MVREQTSLRAFWYLSKNWSKAMEKRREIMKRRRVSDDYIASWFAYEPVSMPASKPLLQKVKARARVAARARAARG
jgi:hypothetical protein